MNFTLICNTHKKPIDTYKTTFGKEWYCKDCKKRIDLENNEVKLINGYLYI